MAVLKQVSQLKVKGMANVLSALLKFLGKFFPFFAVYRHGKLAERDERNKRSKVLEGEIKNIGRQPLSDRNGVLSWLRKGGRG